MPIRRAVKRDSSDWLTLRKLLWPATSTKEHQADIRDILKTPRRTVVFLSRDAQGTAQGFIEAGLRPFADGCKTSPVGYIEGWYVLPQFRGAGIGRRLVRAAECWAAAQGVKEMASDTEIFNKASQRAHVKLGYKPTETIVIFSKRLRTR